MNSRSYLIPSILICCLCAGFVLNAMAENVPLAYQFKVGNVTTYKINVMAEVHTIRAVTGAPSIVDVKQTTTQTIVVEEAVKQVDQTGDAELIITFKEAKMDVDLKSGTTHGPKPPDKLKFLTGHSLTAYITSDGKVLGVTNVDTMVASLRDTVKDALMMELIEQDYTEDFFKELIQNLHPQFPLDPSKSTQNWETKCDMSVPRTNYKIRITTKSSMGQVAHDVAHINIHGDMKAMPVDIDAPVNPSAPTVEVLTSSIMGDEDFSVGSGLLLSHQVIKDYTLRTMMWLRPPSNRGGGIRSDVCVQTHVVITVKMIK